MKSTAIAITIASLLPIQASANQDAAPNYLPQNGDQLAELIENCVETACMSYVSGVINGVGVYSYMAEKPTPFCADETVKSGAIRDAIVATVKGDERLGRIAAPAAILTAFAQNWPCNATPSEDVLGDGGQIDDIQEPLVYQDLPQIDMDALFEFLAEKTFALVLGDPDAPADKTLHVFGDPNCEFCRVMSDAAVELSDLGWKVFIYPTATGSDASKGYGALQYAVRETGTDAPLLLYTATSEAEKDMNSAIAIAQQSGMEMADILNAVALSNPYAAIEKNTLAAAEFGKGSDMIWIMGDRVGSDITDAVEIERIRQSMIEAQTDQMRPGMGAVQ